MLRLLPKFFLLACLCSTICQNGFSQISDSLYNALPNKLKPKDRKNLTSGEKQKIVGYDPNNLSAGNYAEFPAIVASLQKEMDQTNDIRLKLADKKAIADYTYAIGIPKKSLVALASYRQLIAQVGNNKGYDDLLAGAYANLGVEYFYGLKPDSAIECLNTAFDFAQSEKDSSLMVNLYECYTSLYSQLYLEDSALKYAKGLFKLFPVEDTWSRDYTKDMITVSNAYRVAYEKNQRAAYSDSAYKYLSQVMSIKKNESQYWFGACYFALGYLSYLHKDYPTAISLFDSSMLPAYNYASKYYGNYDYFKPLYKGVCLIAMKKYDAGEKILNSITHIVTYAHQALKYKALYEAYTATKNWKLALESHEKYFLYHDSLDLSGKKGKAFEAGQKYSISQKEAAIAKLQSNNLLKDKQQRDIATIGTAILLLIAILIYLYTKKQTAERKKEREALTTSLQQIEDEKNLQQAQVQAEYALGMANQRRDISKNMHDEVSSSLAALKFLIADIKSQHQGEEKITGILDEIAAETDDVYLQARDFMHQLHNSSQQSEYDVIDFLDTLAVRFDADSALHISVEVDKKTVREYFNSLQHQEVYRIVKEAVANTMKHAGASKLSIQLSYENNLFNLRIADNGKGWDAAGEGIGLSSLVERMALLKGRITFNTKNIGFEILGQFPAQGL